MPPQWPAWAEPARQWQDCVNDDPSTTRPDSTLHLSPSPALREIGESRLVSTTNVDNARDRGVDITVTHAAENGGDGDVPRAETLLSTHEIPANGLSTTLPTQEVEPLWRCLMKALVEGRIPDADICWRALRGTMQCVLESGYEQGWSTEATATGPTSPAKFVQHKAGEAVRALDVAQKAPSSVEGGSASILSFSPDCRYVAEYGNTASGGGASYTFDEFTVRVYDTTTGMCVHSHSRKEVQGWCSPYKHSGGSIRSVSWRSPHTLDVEWSDGFQEEQECDNGGVSAFHFTPATWKMGARN